MFKKLLFHLWCVYFNPAWWEQGGRFYERLGIKHVSKLLMGGRYTNAAFGHLRGRRFVMISGRRSAYEWLVVTVVAELGHGLFFLVMLAIAARSASAGGWRDAGVTMLVNTVVNVIPIMVQRYNRARIVRAFGLDAAQVLEGRFWQYIAGEDPRDARTSAVERPEGTTTGR